MIDDLIKKANLRRATIKTIDDVQSSIERLNKMKKQIARIETALNRMEIEVGKIKKTEV